MLFLANKLLSKSEMLSSRIYFGLKAIQDHFVLANMVLITSLE